VENLISKGIASGLKAVNRAAQWNAPERFLGIQAGTLFNRLLGSNLFESRNSKSARSWSALRRNNLEHGAQPPPGNPSYLVRLAHGQGASSQDLHAVAMKNYQKSNVNNRRPAPSVGHRPQRWVSGAGPAPTSSPDAQRNYDRYLALARAEAQSGNTVAAENYYQHAEHYFRLMSSERAK
jgi:hypothetical protein